MILLESKKHKKYKERLVYCPFCAYSTMNREALVNHVDNVHKEMIPQGYTAARVVYDNLNGSHQRTCRICGKPTPWNENKWRYDMLCGDPKCTKAFRDNFKKNAMNKYGTDNLAADPAHQEKMLKARSISSDYRFTDGGMVSYTGTYEKARLEFMDKVLNYKSWEIVCPGPTIEYTYKGKTHFWITDCYIIPHNLVIDDKDGGDHPNERNMPEYRAKQIAKEKAIQAQGEYNYLRLTDKNFGQLLYALSDIKSSFLDETDGELRYYINENAAIMGALAPTNCPNNVYITPYMMNNAFSGERMGVGMTTSNATTVIYPDPITHKLKKKKKDAFFTETPNAIYKVECSPEALKRIYEAFVNGEEVGNGFLYETVTGKTLYDMDQLCFDPLLESVNIEQYSNLIQSIAESTLMKDLYISLYEHDLSIPIFKPDDIKKAEKLLESRGDLVVREDPFGYFILNETTGERTTSYDTIDSIDKRLATLL